MTDGVGIPTMEVATGRRPDRAVNIFVVRSWQPAGAETRYAIAHVQSGLRTVAAGDAVAAAWIGGFGQDEVRPPGRVIAGSADVA